MATKTILEIKNNWIKERLEKFQNLINWDDWLLEATRWVYFDATKKEIYIWIGRMVRNVKNRIYEFNANMEDVKSDSQEMRNDNEQAKCFYEKLEDREFEVSNLN